MSDMTVATTIQAQLGGALMMMGAKDLVAGENYLQFRIGRNPKGVRKVIITLDPSDTYQVEAWRGRSLNEELVAARSSVYVDSLKGVLQAMTGLYTSL
jgi:hypothetical protein